MAQTHTSTSHHVLLKAAVVVGAAALLYVMREVCIPFALAILFSIVVARSWYTAAIGNFYQFFIVENYGLSIKSAQVPLFLFLASGVAGTFFGH